MSLVGSLAKVALGVAAAKAVSGAMRGGSGGAGGSGGLGGALGGLLGGQAGQAGAGGGLGDLMGKLGGATQGQAGGAGGLGDLLGKLGGQGGAGGLGDLGKMLGGAAAGGAASGGGLGGLLESLAGGGASDRTAPGPGSAAQPPSGSLGDLLNSALQGNQPEPTQSQEAQAQVLLTAMINAAKCDGEIDRNEQQKILENLGSDITEEDKQFIMRQMQAPLDLQGLVNSVQPGQEMQVYMMSLMGIDLDSQAEAQYLDGLRKALNITEQQANAIHQKLNAPVLYS